MSDQPPSDDRTGDGFGEAPPPPPPPPAGGGWDVGDRAPLEPMGLGELLDASMRMYGEHWRVMMGIVAAFVIPLELLFQVVSANGGVVGEGVALVFGFLVGPIMAGAVSRAAGEAHLGLRPEVGATVNYTLSRFGPLVLVAILSMLAVLVGLLALIIPGILILVRLYFASVVVVIEGSGALASMKRSADLTRDNLLRLLGIAIVLGLGAAVVALVVQLPFAFLSGMGENHFVAGLGSIVSQLVVTPFAAIAVVLLYFDLRVRKEGFDAAALSRQLRGGLPGGPQDDLGLPPSPWA